ncbi:hypothetical protein [Croceimicrobium hydrocarbonivorans]|uniref:Uncharacterized protein n=1 Tax=Croceimicrobium hydrocarbonivorans TaxID=2761580 RepID=A0A7H0VDD9_9FLAO|nr:hypothetical protein [Croceimicrobium hydrocarbonivorans]QNR23737.1 hypothetical protein H4K34_15360 [Croceimicrobium hydrocarbonivorans]
MNDPFPSIKTILAIWLISLQWASAQISYSINTQKHPFHNFNYLEQKGLSIYADEDGQLKLHSPDDSIELKGDRSRIFDDERQILTYDVHQKKSRLYLYTLEGKLLKKEKLPFSIADLCLVGDSIYILSRSYSYERGQLAKLYLLNKDLEVQKTWNTRLTGRNGININYFQPSKRLMVGAGLEWYQFDLNGNEVFREEVPHASYTLVNGKFFSLLDKLSDASNLFVFQEDSLLFMWQIRLKAAYLYNSFATDHAVFFSWAISPDGRFVVSLDHSHHLSLYDHENGECEEIMQSKNIEFVFFLEDGRLAYLDKKRGIQILKPY